MPFKRDNFCLEAFPATPLRSPTYTTSDAHHGAGNSSIQRDSVVSKYFPEPSLWLLSFKVRLTINCGVNISTQRPQKCEKNAFQHVPQAEKISRVKRPSKVCTLLSIPDPNFSALVKSPRGCISACTHARTVFLLHVTSRMLPPPVTELTSTHHWSK